MTRTITAIRPSRMGGFIFLPFFRQLRGVFFEFCVRLSVLLKNFVTISQNLTTISYLLCILFGKVVYTR